MKEKARPVKESVKTVAIEDKVDKKVYLIKAEIAEVIIGDLLYEPGDEGEEEDDKESFYSSRSMGRSRALSVFSRQVVYNMLREGAGFYQVTVPSEAQLELCIFAARRGLSCAQSALLLQDLRKLVADNGQLVSWSSRKVKDLLRIACAINFQTIYEALKSKWAFSVAIAACNTGGRSYIDVTARFEDEGRLHNIHLIALPSHAGRTEKLEVNFLLKFLDAIAPKWRAQLIGITCDRASSSNQGLQGAVRLLQVQAIHKVYRIWSGADRIASVMTNAFKSMLGNTFVKTLKGLTRFLRREDNLLIEVDGKCPQYTETQWSSMGTVLKWLVAHRTRLTEYLKENPLWAPVLDWWILAICAEPVVRLVNDAFDDLQGPSILVSQQRQKLLKLVSDLLQLGKVYGPLSNEQLETLNGETTSWSGRYAMTFAQAREYIKEQGFFFAIDAMSKHEGLSEQSGKDTSVLRSVSAFFVDVVNGLADVIDENGGTAESAPLVPPVRLHEIEDLRAADFQCMVHQEQSRLLEFCSPHQIEQLKDEHKELKEKARLDPAFKTALSEMSRKSSFEESWQIAGGQFSLLRTFCGCLASVKPGTTTGADEDSSEDAFETQRRLVLEQQEEESLRVSPNVFALEAMLQSRQYERIARLRSKARI